jgi:hypothetical protein
VEYSEEGLREFLRTRCFESHSTIAQIQHTGGTLDSLSN